MYRKMSSFSSPILICALIAAALFSNNILNLFISQSTPQIAQMDPLDSTCRVIANAISNSSSVHWPETAAFSADVDHWASSSSKPSYCSVRPANTEDLSRILQILGWTRTPFAVSGGGHALNPGFSSTKGVHVSMSAFSHLQWNEKEETIDIGAGLRWDDVYDYLNPRGHTVVGGRVRGVGVAGFILGGGLSFLTNEHGLTIDTLLSCEIVLPNGTVAIGSQDENQDLFYGLKGGFNNFGVVTKFTLKVFPQADIWGGTVILAEEDIELSHQAVTNFANTVRDPKATLNIIFEYAEGKMYSIVILFYNGPQPPTGIFDELMALPNGQVSVASMSFTTLLNAGQPRNTPRRIQDVAPIQHFSPTILSKIANETKFWGSYLEQHHSGHFFDYVIEVFLPDYYSHGPASAWPADRSVVHYPINIAFAWFEAQHDAAVYDALRKSVAQIRADTEAEGQDISAASLYPNLPIADTPMERMYGNNLQKLRELRERYDPAKVMNLAGGWRF